MNNFEYLVTTKIVFGRDVITKTGEFVRNYHGDKVLLVHYGSGPVVESGIIDKVKESLNSSDISFTEFGGVQPNPRLSLVYQGIQVAKREGVNFILAVGGGSVIDTGKAIAAGVMDDGDVWDFFIGSRQVTAALPIGVVLTIPAAGSEAGETSVITNDANKLKRDFTTEIVRPKFAIMDPALTFTLPADQTAYGVCDIMAHVMERYFSNVEFTELTDRLCEAVLKTLIHNLPIAREKPDDYAARAEIMWAGSLAHNGLLSTGRIDDWASHTIEHELSGEFDIVHGAGLSIIFPAWMQYVYKKRVDQFCRFAVRVWGVEYDPVSPQRTALEGIHRSIDFFKENGLPTRLSNLGIGDDKLAMLSERIFYDANGEIGNFVKLNKNDVLAIYNLAL